MFPNKFEYEQATSVEHAVALLAESGDEIELLAGGHSLIPTIKSGLASPDTVIDIGSVDELIGIEVGAESTTFGAATTYADIVNHDGVRETAPALWEAISEVGDRQVRNRGTIGGNLAHADPASDLPAAALVEDVELHVQGPDGARSIPVDDFFSGMYATELGPNEILTGVEVPNAASNEVGTYVKKANPASGYALIGIAVSLRVTDDIVEEVNVAVNGAVDSGVKLPSVEDVLQGEPIEASTAKDAAGHAVDDIDEFRLMDDLLASPEYRQQLLEVYTERALNTAFSRAANFTG